jgi:hypothetical protein
MNPQSRKVRSAVILMMLAVATALILVGTSGYLGTTHAAPQQAQTMSAKVIHTDDMQRSARLDHYKLLADSGASRGENIYFFKCWMCHNKYAKTGPYLKNLYQHESMMSGDPVTDRRSKPRCPNPISLMWQRISMQESAALKAKIRRQILSTLRRRTSGPCRMDFQAAQKEWCVSRAEIHRKA